jgi:hypothetical protein
MKRKWPIGQGVYAVDIDPKWLVMDIGSGHNPHPRAEVLVDRELGASQHRGGVAATIPEGKTVVIADASVGLPFKDKSVDFLIASHIAEHVESPVIFIQELTRISHRGYIETPGLLSDALLNEQFHPWRVYRSGKKLVFRRKRKTKPLSSLFYRIFYYDEKRPGHDTEPFTNIIMDRVARRLRLILNCNWSRIPGTYTYYPWEQTVNLKVIE